jgi:hypothetical protein
MNGCNMSFNSVDALQKHMLRHFEDSPGKSSKTSSLGKGVSSAQRGIVKEPAGVSSSGIQVARNKVESEEVEVEAVETAPLHSKDTLRSRGET